MFCPECGKENENTATFCPYCGRQHNVDNASNSNNNPINDIDPSQSWKKSKSKKFKSKQKTTGKKISTRTKIIIIACSVLGLCLIVGGIVAYFIIQNNTDQGKAKSIFNSSDYVKNGVVKNDYVKSEEYKVDNLTIGDINTSGNTKTTTFSATISNKSFKSDLDGEININSSKVNIYNKDTIPLKGVDYYEKTEEEAEKLSSGIDNYETSKNSGSNGNSYNYSNSSNAGKIKQITYIKNTKSELSKDDKGFSCQATSDKTLETWFSKDTCKVNQAFSFDSNNGWSKKGSETFTEKASQYTLDGKEFANEVGNQYNGVHSIKFGPCTPDGNLTCTYTISYDPNQQSTKYYTYKKIDVSGTATGKLSHSFGELTFTFDVSDTANTVKLNGNNTTLGSGTSNVDYVNGLLVDIKTQCAYGQSTSKNSKPDTFSRTGITFKEKTS